MSAAAPLHVVASLPHKTCLGLDAGSAHLGVMKSDKEYLIALEADRLDFRSIIESRGNDMGGIRKA